MDRERKIKQQIINVFTALGVNISFKAFEIGARSTLSTPSILQYGDPEIMEEAGWIKKDKDNNKKFSDADFENLGG